jgi:hypothetical protein
MQYEMQGFHGGDNESYSVLERDAMLCDRGLPTFRFNLLSLFDGLNYDPECRSNSFLKTSLYFLKIYDVTKDGIIFILKISLI